MARWKSFCGRSCRSRMRVSNTQLRLLLLLLNVLLGVGLVGHYAYSMWAWWPEEKEGRGALKLRSPEEFRDTSTAVTKRVNPLDQVKVVSSWLQPEKQVAPTPIDTPPPDEPDEPEVDPDEEFPEGGPLRP